MKQRDTPKVKRIWLWTDEIDLMTYPKTLGVPPETEYFQTLSPPGVERETLTKLIKKQGDNPIPPEVERYILFLSARSPQFYKKDIQQEGRLCYLQLVSRPQSGKLQLSGIKARILRRVKSLEKLERNRGITDCKDDIDMAKIEEALAEHFANCQSNNEGRLLFNNRL